jgi:apolipoprotein N-acyltransferase
MVGVTAVLRDRSARLRLGAAVLSGVLLALAFPALDWGPLALVALVPLLWAWRGAGPARAALYGFVFGAVFLGILLYWIWYFGAYAYVPLIAACAAYSALTGALVGWLGRCGLASPWLVGAAWVVPEALRGRFPLGGFPWGDLGAALHDVPAARALASWGGVALVSYLVVVVNALVLDLALAARAGRRSALRDSAVAAVGVVALVAVAVGLRIEPDPTGHLRVALLQGNDRNRDLTVAERNTFLPESHLALGEGLTGSYDLIVFPESALGDLDPQVDRTLQARIVGLAEAHDADVLVNALVEVPGPDDRIWNMNLLYEPDGTLQGRYAKEHLVPFGEYVPLRSHLGFIKALERVPRDFKPGDERVLFDVRGHQVASVICFESAFAPLVRDFVRDGAEVVVVSTNNRSYRRSSNAAQHLAVSQMRAAETGRPVLQASVSGISGVIDASGDVLETSRLFHNRTLSAVVTTMTGETPYVRFGDWVVWGSAVALVVAAVVGRRRLLRVEPADRRLVAASTGRGSA